MPSQNVVFNQRFGLKSGGNVAKTRRILEKIHRAQQILGRY
jgi:hypothetical protein